MTVTIPPTAAAVPVMRPACVEDLLDPDVRDQWAVAYWPGLDDLATSVDAVYVSPSSVRWLHVDDAQRDGISVRFVAGGRTFRDFAEWNIVLGLVAS